MSESLLAPPTHRDTLHTVTWATLALLLWIAAITFLWTLRPLDPVPRLNLTVMGPTVAGGYVRVMIDYCKTEGYTPESVRWSLVDGVTIMLDPLVVTLEPGCHTTLLILPTAPQMVEGTYKLRVDGIYRPYPWRSAIIVSATSNDFTVQ
jgi:hypothetical protein